MERIQRSQCQFHRNWFQRDIESCRKKRFSRSPLIQKGSRDHETIGG